MAYSLSNKATELIKELKRSEWIPRYNVGVFRGHFMSRRMESAKYLTRWISWWSEFSWCMKRWIHSLRNSMRLGRVLQSRRLFLYVIRIGRRRNWLMGSTRWSTSTTAHSTTTSDVCMPICRIWESIWVPRNHRLNKLREYRWRKGELNAKEVSTLMSKEETKYFQEYDQLLNSYMQSSGFDLTAVWACCGFERRTCSLLTTCMWRWLQRRITEKSLRRLEQSIYPQNALTRSINTT